jgi:hypothetical protein
LQTYLSAELQSLHTAAVYLDGKRLQMSVDENEQEHILGLELGEMMLLWQLHRPDMGQAVEITTGAQRRLSNTSFSIFADVMGTREKYTC